MARTSISVVQHFYLRPDADRARLYLIYQCRGCGCIIGIARRFPWIADKDWRDFANLLTSISSNRLRSSGEAIYSRGIEKRDRENGRHRRGGHGYAYKHCIRISACLIARRRPTCTRGRQAFVEYYGLAGHRRGDTHSRQSVRNKIIYRICCSVSCTYPFVQLASARER